MNIEVKNLRPVSDRVVIRPDEKETQTASGIFKPENAKESHQVLSGVVVAVGPGTPGCPMNLKVDEKVLFPEHTGTTISGGLLIIQESKILTVI